MPLLTITVPCKTENPLQLFRIIQLTKQKNNRLQQKSGNKEKKKKEAPLICSHCSAAITTSKQAISLNGQHQHTFFNPAGIVFEIRCFRQAPGCEVNGKPTIEFSWFDGYSWQFATCSSCLAQLGWFFMSAKDKDPFFGLISSKVI
jgi:hypothetical protein